MRHQWFGKRFVFVFEHGWPLREILVDNNINNSHLHIYGHPGATVRCREKLPS